MRSSVAEVAAAMKADGFASYDYPKDRHFEAYVLRDITSNKQLRALVRTLKADAKTISPGWAGFCSKTYSINLQEKNPDMILMQLAMARRTCCGCHETGSFALRQRPKVTRFC